MLSNYELSEMLYDLCTKFYNENIYIIKDKWTVYKTKEDFDCLIKTTKKEWFEDIIKYNVRYNYTFNRNNIIEKVQNQIGYMWSNPITDIFKAYKNNTVNEEDLYRYIELININFNNVKNIIIESDINHFGSDKFKNALYNYADWFKNVLNNIDKKTFVENMIINEPTNRLNQFVIEYTFNKHIQYNNKNKFKNSIREKILEKYKSIMSTNNWYGIHEIRGFSNYFADSGKKTLPCNKFIITIESNKWNAIATSEDSQFMPIMKKMKGF